MCQKIKKNKKSHPLDFTVPFLSFFFVGRRETIWFLSIFLLVDCKCFMNKSRVLPQWVRRWVLTGRSGFRPLPPPLSLHMRVSLCMCEFVVSLHVWVPFSSRVSLCPRLCKSLKGPSPLAGIPKKNASWTKEILLKEWNEEVYDGRVYLMWKLIYFLTHKVTLEFRSLRRLNQLSWIVMIITIYVWEILSSTCEVEYEKENVEVICIQKVFKQMKEIFDRIVEPYASMATTFFKLYIPFMITAVRHIDNNFLWVNSKWYGNWKLKHTSTIITMIIHWASCIWLDWYRCPAQFLQMII